MNINLKLTICARGQFSSSFCIVLTFFVLSVIWIFLRSVSNFYHGECFVDYKYPFASCWIPLSHGWTVFCEQMTPTCLEVIWFLLCLKISLPDRSCSYVYSGFWFNCGLICKFELPPLVSTVFGWRMKPHLPSGIFFLRRVNIDLPERPCS